MPKFVVTYNERTTRRAEIEADSLEEVFGNWCERYSSGLVDEIEAVSVEVDGGIDWDSVEIKEA